MPFNSELNIDICVNIAQSYQKALGKKDSDTSAIKNLITGTFYRGTHSSYFLRDFLAGGVTNNFFFNWFPRSDYGNFIFLVDAICKQGPDADAVLTNIIEINTREKLNSFVDQNQRYVPRKCYNDLKADISGNARYYNSPNRKAETESHRFSKVACLAYAFCQGFIEMMGINGFYFIAGLSAPWSISVMTGVFIVAFFVNYSFSREDTYQLIKRWKEGNLFKRNVGTLDTPSYEDFTTTEKNILILFACCSVFAGLCIYGLGVSAMLATTLPPLVVYLLPLSLIMPASIVFSKIAHKFIDENGWDKVKKYFFNNFTVKNRYDILGIARIILWEIPKLFFSITVSAIIFYATLCMLRGKSVILLSHIPYKNMAMLCATMAAGITAGVKFIFSVSKISELLESASIKMCELFASARRYLFNRKGVDRTEERTLAIEEDKSIPEKPEPVLNRLQKKNRVSEGFQTTCKALCLFIHSGSEAGLILGSTKQMNPSEKVAGAVSKGCYSFFTCFKPIFNESENVSARNEKYFSSESKSKG